jgi:hypothetical protein
VRLIPRGLSDVPPLRLAPPVRFTPDGRGFLFLLIRFRTHKDEIMTDNVTQLPRRDLIAEITGPARLGHDVILEGRLVPNLVMYDRRPNRDEIEFCLDGRVMFGFPAAYAWNAAAFAFAAMAVGAGHDPLNFEPRPFAKKVVRLGDDGSTDGGCA